MADGVGRVCRRFPEVIVSLLLFTCMLVGEIHQCWSVTDSKVVRVLVFYSGMAVLLGTGLRLWLEDRPHSKRRVAIVVLAYVVLLLLLVAHEWGEAEPDFSIYVAFLLSTIALLKVGALVVAFLRQPNDLPLWNFVRRLLVGAVVSIAAGAVVMVGLEVLMECIESLFGFAFDRHLSYDVPVVCFTFVTPFIFLQFIPDGKQKHDTSAEGLPVLVGGVVRYLLLPLLGLYFVTLYVYAARILFSWTLPDGMVSLPVICLMLGMLIIEALLYPSKFRFGATFDCRVMRLLPWLTLPLLLLMSVAIARRVSDYGLTMMRLYLITFNVWCYAVCLYLILMKARKISWIPVSFVALFFLTSTGPQAYPYVVLKSFKQQFKELAAQNGNPELPLEYEEMNCWIEALPDTVAKNRLRSRLDYLTVNYGQKNIADVVTYETESVGVESKASECLFASGDLKAHGAFKVVGFDSLYVTDNAVFDVRRTSVDSDTLWVKLYGGEVPLNVMTLRHYAESDVNDVLFEWSTPKCKALIESFDYHLDSDSITLGGLFFYKTK